MNSVTDQLRRNLAERHVRTESKTLPHGHRSASSEQKLMQHFETINKIGPTNGIGVGLQNLQQKFAQTIVEYSSKGSRIDEIINLTEDALQLLPFSQQLVEAPITPNLKQSSYNQIRTIHEIFQGKEQKENRDSFNNTLLVVQIFSEALKDIGRINRAFENKLLAISKVIVKEPNYTELQMKQIQTDPQQFEPVRNEQQSKMMKKDLILMQLLREKKRKIFAADYFGIMEMKLMELLDFILQDEQEYVGLDPQSKIKLVLKNLQSFQGRTMEGESKINLLKIFFQEFTSLKREKEDLQAMSTPMKKVENKQKHGTTSTKVKESKEGYTPQRKQSKSRKEVNVPLTENERVQKKQKKRAKADEWIGSLK